MRLALPLNKYAAALAALLLAAALAYSYFTGPRSVPAVVFTTVTGQLVSTQDLRGKVVLVNFWATDCIPCIEEMPRIAQVYGEFQARGFDTIAVAISYDPPNRVVSYAERNKLPFKVALDVQGEIARRFGDVSFTPTSFLIDRRGAIVRRYVGAPDFIELRSLIEEALTRPS